MKRLMILTMMAALAASLGGCSRAWPRFWWYQGDPCNLCTPYQSLPTVTEELVAPPAPTTRALPGPAEA